MGEIFTRQKTQNIISIKSKKKKKKREREKGDEAAAAAATCSFVWIFRIIPLPTNKKAVAFKALIPFHFGVSHISKGCF